VAFEAASQMLVAATAAAGAAVDVNKLHFDVFSARRARRESTAASLFSNF